MMTSTLLYKDHAIIAAAKRDEKPGKYKPVVHISWHALNGKRESHSFAPPEGCDTFEKASTLALKAAKTRPAFKSSREERPSLFLDA